MCHGCWEEYGKPQIDSPEIQRTAGLVNEVYKHSGVGLAEVMLHRQYYSS